MVGSAIVRRLEADGTHEVICRPRAELDLTDQAAVRAFYRDERPDAVILAAAKVGGIHANNTYPADFIYQNMMIEANLIEGAFRAGVERLVFLGSSCIYPREAPQPITEEALLTGPLEPTNEPYAVAKIAGIKLCESFNRQHGTDYRSLMPTNLYGPGDNFHPENSHVLPALIRRFTEARESGTRTVTIWGTGRPRREFLHVDDLAAAVIFALEADRARWAGITAPMRSHVNVGTGEDISIAELARLVQEVTGHEGEIAFDTSKPDGTPRKLLDVGRMHSLGWRARIPLRDGLSETFRWFLENRDAARL